MYEAKSFLSNLATCVASGNFTITIDSVSRNCVVTIKKNNNMKIISGRDEVFNLGIPVFPFLENFAISITS